MNRIFESANQKIARMLARQYGINVVFEGVQPRTDGKTITLPAFVELSPELELDMAGYLDHEVAHCKFTQFDLLAKSINRFHKELLNATEDIRIETEMKKEFPGTEGHIRPLREKLYKEWEKSRPKSPWPIRLLFAIQHEMYGDKPLLDKEIQEYFDLIEPERKKLTDCKSTLELYDLTKKMIEKISKEEEKKEEEKKEEGKKEEGDDGESEDGDGESDENDTESKKDDTENKKSKKKGKPKKMKGAEVSSSKEAEPATEKAEGSEISPEPFEKFDKDWDKQVIDITDLVKEKTEKEAERNYLYSDKKHIPYTTAYDVVIHEKGDALTYARIKNRVSSVINPTKRALGRALTVKENARWAIDKERGSVNTRSLCKLAVTPGFRTPFKELTKTETKNIAIEILIDMSGSMAYRMETAQGATVAMAEALKSLNIPFEVTGFQSMYSLEAERKIGTGDVYSEFNRWNRWREYLSHHVFKDFRSDTLTGISRLYDGSNNVDGESVRWAANRLSKQKQKRKILMVLSDGFPEAEGRREILNSDLKNAVSEIKKSGIECIGIGIQTTCVKNFYPDWVVINELKDLPSVCMGKLTKLILK